MLRTLSNLQINKVCQGLYVFTNFESIPFCLLTRRAGIGIQAVSAFAQPGNTAESEDD